jgi:hypothetical protein
MLYPRTSKEIWQGISGIYLCSLFAMFKSTLRFLTSRQIEYGE